MLNNALLASYICKEGCPICNMHLLSSRRVHRRGFTFWISYELHTSRERLVSSGEMGPLHGRFPQMDVQM